MRLLGGHFHIIAVFGGPLPKLDKFWGVNFKFLLISGSMSTRYKNWNTFNNHYCTVCYWLWESFKTNKCTAVPVVVDGLNRLSRSEVRQKSQIAADRIRLSLQQCNGNDYMDRLEQLQTNIQSTGSLKQNFLALRSIWEQICATDACSGKSIGKQPQYPHSDCPAFASKLLQSQFVHRPWLTPRKSIPIIQWKYCNKD